VTAQSTDSDYDKIFVGREKELTDFETLIRSVDGQVLIVVGDKGIGKSYLLERLQYEAMNEYECFTIFHKFYASTEPKDHVKVLLNDIYDRTGILFKHGNFIQNAVKIIPWVGQSLSEALGAPTGSDTYKFTLFLRRVSDHIEGEDQRLLVLVDPRDEMEKKEHLETFREIIDTVKETPRIKVVIAQRPHDVIITCKEIMDQDHVHRFDIDKFREEEIKECVECRLPGIDKSDEIAQGIYQRTRGVPLECNRILSAIEFNPDYRSAEGLRRLPESTEGMDDLIIMSLTPPERSALLYMSILKISADLEFLSHYFDFEFPEMERILDEGRIAPLLRVERAETTPRYYIYHDEFQKFLLEKLRQDETLKISNLQKRAAESFYRRIEKNRNDAEALTEYTYHLLESGDRRAFIRGLDTVKDDKDRIGLYQQLKEELKEALSYEEINEKLERKGWFLNQRGVVHQRLGELQKALDCHTSAEVVFQKIEDEGGQGAQYGNIGLILADKGDLEGALENHRKALQINEKIGRPEGIAKNYGNIGLVLADKGDLEGALENHKKALEISKKIGRPEGMAGNYGNIGIVLHQKGDLQGALENHKKALEINKKIGRPEGMANNYGSIGSALADKGDLEGALENHRKALEINMKIGRREGLANNYGNIANVMADQGNLQGALGNYMKVLEIEDKLGRPHSIAKAYGNIGVVLADKGDLQGALENYKKGLEINKKIGNPSGMAANYINIANIDSQKSDYKSAALLQLQALLIYAQIGMKQHIEIAQRNLARSIAKLKEQGKFEEFLREAKEKFGEEVEKLFTADEADETDSPSA